MLAMLLTGTVSYRWMVIADESNEQLAHTHKVLSSIRDLLLAMKSAESSSLDFALTNNDTDIEFYRASMTKVKQDEVAVRNLVADNPAQQSRLSSLESLAAQIAQQDESTIALRQQKGTAAVVAMRNAADRQITDEFEVEAGGLQEQELRSMTLQTAVAAGYERQLKLLLIVGLSLGLLFASAAVWSGEVANSKRAQVYGALKDSEDKLRLLLDGMQDYAIFMLDAEGRVVSWNASAERVNGYTAEQIVGQSFARFFTEKDLLLGKPEEILRIATEKGRFEEAGMRVRPDGSKFMASVSGAALHDAAGNLRGFSVFTHDLTARLESEARYRGLLEAAPDGMVVVDQRGRIVLLNAQAEKQFGYRRDELLGQEVKSIIPEGFAERTIADGTRTAAEALAQQIGTGIELNGRRKDGSEFPIEIMLSPLESAGGILVTAAIRDITVRRSADRHLVQMEARYRGLMEAAPDAMVVVNERGEIVLLNARAENQFGYRRNELLGQNVKSLIPEGFAERLIADGARTPTEALAQQIGTGIELCGQRKDGSRFPIEIMLSPLESGEGMLVTAAIRDIAIRKAADAHLVEKVQELNRSNEELEQFAYVASHDLQEPLC